METTVKTLQTTLDKLTIAFKVASFILETRLCRDEQDRPCAVDLRAGIETKLPPVFPALFANEVRALDTLISRREAWALNVLRSMAGHSAVDEELVTSVHAAARYASTLLEAEIAKREREQKQAARAEQKQRGAQAAAAAAEEQRQEAETKRLTAAIRVLGVQELRGEPSLEVLERLLARHRAIALEWIAAAVKRVNSLALEVGEPIVTSEVDDTATETAIRERLDKLFELEHSLETQRLAQAGRRAQFRRSQRALADAHDRVLGKRGNGRRGVEEKPRTDTKFAAQLREFQARARVAAAE